MPRKKIKDYEQRVANKKKLRKKKNMKNRVSKTTLYSSIVLNIYYVSIPYHVQILTNITETYHKIAPILENLINKLPL